MLKYIRAAGLCTPPSESLVDEIVAACDYRIAFPPEPHSKVGGRPPSTDAQQQVSIDVVHFEGKIFLHIVDECKSWSETGLISRKSITVQVEVLNRIQLLCHCSPESIRCDREHDNVELKSFCKKADIQRLLVAANDDEANGLVENANRTLRSYFDRLRACDKRSSTALLIAEATYGKNISLGSKRCSAFELHYGRHPPLLPVLNTALPPASMVEQNARYVAKRRINQMLRSNLPKNDHIVVGDIVAIWRDGSGWLFPARVTKVTPYYYEVVHHGRLKSSGINRAILMKNLASQSHPCQHNELDRSIIPSPNSQYLPSDNDSDSDGQQDFGDSSNSSTHDSHPPACAPTPTEPTTQTATGQSANRIPTAELRRLLENAASVVQERTRSTRSQTAASNNVGQYTHGQSLQSIAGASISTYNGADETTEADVETKMLSHFLSHLVGLPDSPSESSSTSKLSNEERGSAFEAELNKWKKRKSFTPVAASSVPSGSNVIGSHVVYKRKLDLSPKERIVPWGHRDKDKDFLRGDAPSVSLEVLHLLLSLAVEFKWPIGQMDIETAFLQALGFTRLIYVRPSREAGTTNILWRLELAAYSLTDSGRLWYLTSDKELIESFGLIRSPLDYTLYYSENQLGTLDFVLAVQVDDYLYTGPKERMSAFELFLSAKFDVGKFVRKNLSLMGCDIVQQDDFSIQLPQELMLSQVDPQLLLDSAGSKGDQVATLKQATVFRHIIGKILYVGRMSAPLLLLHASMAATKIADLHIHHIRALASVLKRLKSQGGTLHFESPPLSKNRAAPSILDVISDGAVANKGDSKGREGYIIFRRLGTIVHPIQWCARRLRRVSRSSSTAETLAAADAISNCLYIKELMGSLLPSHIRELTIDSSSLQSLSTSIKEPEERYNKVDLAAIREVFDSGQLNAVHWCPNPQLLADPLTKVNPTTAALFIDVLSSGKYERPVEMKTNYGIPQV